MNANKCFQRTVNICGEDVLATIIPANGEEWVRVIVEGCWSGPQDTSKTTDEMLVEPFEDGSFSITVSMLIHPELCADTNAMGEMCDNIINDIEDALGLDTQSLSSSGFIAGSQNADWDYLMPEKDKVLLRLAGIDTAKH